MSWCCNVIEVGDCFTETERPLLSKIRDRCSSFTYERKISRTSSGQRFVHWAVIDTLARLLSVRRWFQPNDRHVGVQLLRSGFGQFVFVVVPSSTFEEETPNEASVIGARG